MNEPERSWKALVGSERPPGSPRIDAGARLRQIADTDDVKLFPLICDDLRAAAGEIELLRSIVLDLGVAASGLQMDGRHFATCDRGVQLTHEQWGAVLRAEQAAEAT